MPTLAVSTTLVVLFHENLKNHGLRDSATSAAGAIDRFWGIYGDRFSLISALLLMLRQSNSAASNDVINVQGYGTVFFLTIEALLNITPKCVKFLFAMSQ
jgi:hypothetical protein